MRLFVGVWVGSYSDKGQRGQRSVYLKNGVCVNGEWEYNDICLTFNCTICECNICDIEVMN